MNKITVVFALLLSTSVWAHEDTLHVSYAGCTWFLPKYFEIGIPSHDALVDGVPVVAIVQSGTKDNKMVWFTYKEVDGFSKDNVHNASPYVQVGDFSVASMFSNRGNMYMHRVEHNNNDHEEMIIFSGFTDREFWDVFNECQDTYRVWDESVSRYHVIEHCDDGVLNSECMIIQKKQ